MTTGKTSKIPSCPVAEPARASIRAAHSFARALRRLCRAQLSCASCPASADCPLLDDLNAQIDAAITDLTTEWGLL